MINNCPSLTASGTLLVWGFVRTADQEQVGKFGAGGIGKPGDPESAWPPSSGRGRPARTAPAWRRKREIENDVLGA